MERNIILYPEPYFGKKELIKEYKEIEIAGFEPDDLLSMHPNMPVYGLNIAFGWPLPNPLRETYEKLYHELLTLGQDIYIYPYHQTHITLMTLVNFKNHKYPGEEIKKIENHVPEIIDLLSKTLSDSSGQPFNIDVGPPVLLKSAAILPILNSDREIFRLRNEIAIKLKDFPFLEIKVPKRIHSTILRFLKRLPDVNGFIEKFESIASKYHKEFKHNIDDYYQAKPVINELLLTSETKPYMRGGEKLYRFKLGK